MSDEILKKAAKHPLFHQTFASGLSNITFGAQLLISLGVDISEETTALLKKIEQTLRNATYDSLNLDELLMEAQAMGDDIATREKDKEFPTTE